MPALALHPMTAWITAAAIAHPNDLVAHAAERSGTTRGTARRALRQLVASGWLVREGPTSRPRYRPGLQRQVTRTYALQGLAEDEAWRRDVAGNFDLAAPVERLLQHAFFELLNNAIDHSGGTRVTVSLRQTPSHVQLLVSDDGRGLFETIRARFGIDDAPQAMVELAKGRLTSDPSTHTGRGLFFAVRLADVFDVHANGSAFQHRGWEASGWRVGRPFNPAAGREGTSVYLSIALDTPRTLAGVLAQASADGNGLALDATRVPLKLLAAGMTTLDARSQARRVAERLVEFRRVELDFGGIDDIGHGFADELFRVFARSAPQVELITTGACARVAAVVRAVQVGH